MIVMMISMVKFKLMMIIKMKNKLKILIIIGENNGDDVGGIQRCQFQIMRIRL